MTAHEILERRLTPRLRRALLEAFDQARDRIPARAVERIIREGLLAPDRIATLLRNLPDVERVAREGLRMAARRGAAVALETLPVRSVRGLLVEPRFDLVNPAAIRLADQATALLVTRITLEQQLALQQIVRAGIEHGWTIPEQARLIRQVVGLNDRQARALGAFRDRLIAGRVPDGRIGTLVDRYAAKLLRQRALMIARTENVFALSAGQDEAWKQAQARGLLRAGAASRWVTATDERVCPVCGPMHGQVRPLGQPFTDPRGRQVFHPPLHPMCRCTRVIDARNLSMRRAS